LIRVFLFKKRGLYYPLTHQQPHTLATNKRMNYRLPFKTNVVNVVYAQIRVSEALAAAIPAFMFERSLFFSPQIDGRKHRQLQIKVGV
jgi:hypothetical protein